MDYFTRAVEITRAAHVVAFPSPRMLRLQEQAPDPVAMACRDIYNGLPDFARAIQDATTPERLTELHQILSGVVMALGAQEEAAAIRLADLTTDRL